MSKSAKKPAQKKKNPETKSGSVLSKRKAKKEIKQVIEANTLFIEFVEKLIPAHTFSEQELENLEVMKEHFSNLNVHFYDVIGNIK